MPPALPLVSTTGTGSPETVDRPRSRLHHDPVADYDVAVVGSGVAGPALAVLLARQGLRVALLEAHRDPTHYKRLCTHLLQSSALPVLERLGLEDALEGAGAVRSTGSLWTRYGWVRDPAPLGRPPHGYNVRREVLDPLLRRQAGATPGVDLLLGSRVRGLLHDSAGRVAGVRVRRGEGVQEVTASLVVGADGRSSIVADRAGLEAQESPNARFGYFAHYRGVEVADGHATQFWHMPPDAAYTFPTDDGVTLVAAMPGKARWQEFQADREGALLGMFADLDAAPDLSRAERVSDIVGVRDYPSLTRRSITAPGVALVGDAAMVGDPLWGVGCGFALQSAAWLADAVGPALAGAAPSSARDRAVDAAARSYGRQHKRRLGPHQRALIDLSSGRDFNPVERLLFAGAARDPVVADRVWAYGTRNAAPRVLTSPRLLARAVRARRTSAAPA